MLNSYVILFLISLFSVFASYPIIGRPHGWKTVPYNAYYGKNRVENGPSHGRGHEEHHPNRQGHYGFENSNGHRPHGPPGPGHGHGPGPGHGHGPIINHGHPGPGHGHGPIIGHGHGYGHEHGHGHGHKGHFSKPFIPIPVPEKTAFLSKLIPIAGFGGSALKRLLSFGQDEYSSHGYSHRSGQSLWPWHNPGPLWSANGNPRPVEVKNHHVWKRST